MARFGNNIFLASCIFLGYCSCILMFVLESDRACSRTLSRSLKELNLTTIGCGLFLPSSFHQITLLYRPFQFFLRSRRDLAEFRKNRQSRKHSFPFPRLCIRQTQSCLAWFSIFSLLWNLPVHCLLWFFKFTHLTIDFFRFFPKCACAVSHIS